VQEEPPVLNPYAPPEAEIDRARTDFGGYEVLARPSTRFSAKTIDQALVAGILLLGVLFQFVISNGSDFGVVALVIGGAGASAMVIYQWYLISTTGRSLGKRWCHIKILRVDGQEVDFVSGVVMRSWLPFFVALIPGVGSIFGLVDACFIFGDDRRCVHDRMAGTKVVVAR
jgi:uncharacterized RDD family membrane protein YckC